MPTYTFRCESCNAQWEEMQSISLDKHESSCPKCKKIYNQTLVSGNGFAFVDRHWNPVEGFPTNDAKVNKHAKDIRKGKA